MLSTVYILGSLWLDGKSRIRTSKCAQRGGNGKSFDVTGFTKDQKVLLYPATKVNKLDLCCWFVCCVGPPFHRYLFSLIMHFILK